MVSIGKVYANREWVYGYRENDQLVGDDSDISSKAGAEIVIASCKSSLGGEA